MDLEYPKRPQFFAMRFIRLMVKAVVATELGQNVFTLLTAIASTEDARRYKSPVAFHDGQLMPLVGVSKWDTLEKARAAAIAAGWLVRIPPGRGSRQPTTYWVTIPEGLEDLEDTPVDDGISEFQRGYLAGKAETVEQSIPRSIPATTPNNGGDDSIRTPFPGIVAGIDSGIEADIDLESKRRIFSPIPNPIPIEEGARAPQRENALNARRAMAESPPVQDAAIHAILVDGEPLLYFPGDERWTRAFVAWWKSLAPHVRPWPYDDLDDHLKIELSKRLLESKWYWKRTAGFFPLHSPSDWKPDIEWFLARGNVTKILAGKYEQTSPVAPRSKPAKDVNAGIRAILERERTKSGETQSSNNGAVFENRGAPDERDATRHAG